MDCSGLVLEELQDSDSGYGVHDSFMAMDCQLSCWSLLYWGHIKGYIILRLYWDNGKEYGKWTPLNPKPLTLSIYGLPRRLWTLPGLLQDVTILKP